MNQNQRTKKAEQLRLAAQIIETGCEWEVKCGDSPEWLGNESPFVAAYKGDAGVAVAHGYEIRIKEPAVPEGWRELRDDEKDGRWIEGVKYLGYKGDWKHHETTKRGVGCYGLLTSRVIVPVTKPKKRVPLGPEDVVPGSALRPIERPDAVRDCWAAVISTGEVGVQAVRRGDIEGYSYHDLMSEFEIKRPTDTEWQPCWKEAS